MISSVRGPVASTGHGFVVIEVGGLGIRVEVPSLTATTLHRGQEARLETALIVREDSMTVYGFETADELDVFHRLMSVSGVGPRSALGVLSELRPTQIIEAVMNEDPKPFTKVPGIGPKTAKLITVSLSGKLKHLEHLVTDEADTPSQDEGDATQVIVGLIGLGWPEAQAAQAVADALAAGAGSQATELMRASLALLQAPRTRTGANS